jgi:hypothetical protein
VDANTPKALFHVALALPLIALLAKLHKWTEAAMFFDGTGIGMSQAHLGDLS